MANELNENDEDFVVFQAGKRLGIVLSPIVDSGDWFISWSPRNCNNFAEGQWSHWVNLAKFILSHPATNIVDPEAYKPELVANPELYLGGDRLSGEQVKDLFFLKQEGA